MRFEVKGGGIAAILFAMTLLSGAVFVLGLLAGYDVGRQAQIDTAQLATSFSLQSPPASPTSSNPSQAETGNSTRQAASNSVSPEPRTSASPVVASADNGATPGSNSSTPTLPKSNENPSRRNFVAASVPPTAQPGRTHLPTAQDAASSETPEAGDEPSEAPGDTGPENGRRVASSVQPPRHRPYNIQIEAAMDISGADQMMGRLQKLGYTSHLVPTEIDGQRWYKVEVGPYATAEEASAAEAQLRERYDATYGGVARRNPAAQNSENEDSEE
ncbi:MAG: SPOR domain-containing protein [Deltaproteobacteria bacterium]|nr:SPOR domain-containing protein [Deltaproteobacteria bacterium]